MSFPHPPFPGTAAEWYALQAQAAVDEAGHELMALHGFTAADQHEVTDKPMIYVTYLGREHNGVHQRVALLDPNPCGILAHVEAWDRQPPIKHTKSARPTRLMAQYAYSLGDILAAIS